MLTSGAACRLPSPGRTPGVAGEGRRPSSGCHSGRLEPHGASCPASSR